MPCEAICPREANSAHPASPGVVQNDELVCRAGYGPKSHYNASGLKHQFIRAEHLIAGELSVWRLARDFGEADLEGIVAINREHEPPKNRLYDIFAAQVADIRSIETPSHNGRVISVIDDCRTDNNGGSHPAHAVLAICQEIREGMDKNSIEFVEIRDELLKLFRRQAIWALPTEER